LTTISQPAAVVRTNSCPTCSTELLGEFCHHCGEKRPHEHELGLKHFALHSVHELTHLDSKIFATLRYLFSRPGFLTQEYVAGRRSLYMKPLSLFLIACATLFLVDSVFPHSVYEVDWITRVDKTKKVDALWAKLAAKKHVTKDVIMQRIQDEIHEISTAMQFTNVLVVSVMLSLLYRRRYFVEHLVFAFHLLSFSYLVGVLLRPLASWLGVLNLVSTLLSVAVSLLLFVYLFLALRRVYREDAGVTFAKALLTQVFMQGAIITTQIVTLLVAVVAAARS
jgi:hypothetical protein